MLGIGTSVTSIDPGQIYKELSELESYASLAIHFDFSTLTGVHGSEVTAATNLVAGGSAFNISTNSGTPSLDRNGFGGRSSVAFQTGGDYLNLGREFTSSNKSFTFFVVLQRDDTEDLAIIGSSESEGITNYIKFIASGTRIETVMGEEETGEATTLNSTSGSTVDYTQVAGVPSVLVIRRETNGVLHVHADNGLYIAGNDSGGMKSATNFRLLTIGGNVGHHPSTTYDGNIGEVGIYDADIGVQRAITLSKELSTKWGVNRRS
tara:strand:- start:1133 stop:1924 length:792 start_codon:yes stop_codon:yes gene_type:complete